MWQVLKALRAHDRRLADELDHLRTSLGRESAAPRKIHLPPNIVLDASRVSLDNFEQAFDVRAVERATESNHLPSIKSLRGRTSTMHGKWPTIDSGLIPGTNESWGRISNALRTGLGTSRRPTLPQSLRKHRGHKYHLARDPLTVEQILAWADAYKAKHGKWPNQTSGAIEGTNRTWTAVNIALTRLPRPPRWHDPARTS